ncbi:MAG TPA: hypothetical protein VFS21_18120 [Roseiflexaceae bacterium]|nr:hypothetical protein [Roseiflexaceae bacterium]
MTTPTVDQILRLAHQLPREQRRQLMIRLEQEFATEVPPPKPSMTKEEARVAWAQLRGDLSARPAGSTTMAEQLDTDRRSRDNSLKGDLSDEQGVVSQM